MRARVGATSRLAMRGRVPAVSSRARAVALLYCGMSVTSAKVVPGLLMTGHWYSDSSRECDSAAYNSSTFRLPRDGTEPRHMTAIAYASLDEGETACYAWYMAPPPPPGTSHPDHMTPINSWDDVANDPNFFWVKVYARGWQYVVSTVAFCQNDTLGVLETGSIFVSTIKSAGMAHALNNAQLGTCLTLPEELRRVHPWVTAAWFESAYNAAVRSELNTCSSINNDWEHDAIVVYDYKLLPEQSQRRRLTTTSEGGAFPDPPHIFPARAPSCPALTPGGITGVVLASVFGIALIVTIAVATWTSSTREKGNADGGTTRALLPPSQLPNGSGIPRL